MQKTCLILILTALLASCQPTHIDLQSRVELPTAYTHAKIKTDHPAIQAWWDSWQDPQLSKLIQQGLAKNYDITIAKSKLSEARAIAKLAHASLFPIVSGVGNTGKAHLDVEQLNVTPQAMVAGLNLSWEPDIFGQKQSDSDAAQAATLILQEQIYGAQLLVSSEIAHYYLNALYTQKQQALLRKTQTTLEHLKRYVKGRFQAGHTTYYEVTEVASQLQMLQAKASTLQAQFDTYQRAIAVLINQPVQTFKLNMAHMSQVDVLTHLPAAPQGTQPSDLLTQRPDIRAKAASVQLRAAKLASAKADLLPRFTLQFLWQTGRIELDSDLPTLHAWQNLVSAGIQLPIFTAGRINANIQAADARLQQALLEYDKTLLNALKEVENRYQSQFALTHQHQILKQTLALKQQQAIDSQTLFRYGEYTFDRALKTRLESFKIEESLLENQLTKANNLILLYNALGFGWQTEK